MNVWNRVAGIQCGFWQLSVNLIHIGGMTMKRVFVFSVLMLALAVHSTWAEAPKTMSYQGVLQDNNGQAINGSRSLAFVIYAANGSAIWNETHSVTVTDGVFGVVLGTQGSPLDLPFNEPYTMGIAIDGNPELSPRVPLVSSPYSLNTRGVSHTNGATVIGNPTRIHASSNQGALSFGMNLSSRILGLWDDPVGWYGMGIEPSMFRFQIGNTGARYSFFAGDNTQVMSLDGAGNLNPSGSIHINGANVLEFGTGVAKEASAGKIGYATFTAGTLDIVGAGTLGTNRRIRFWNEGGAEFTGSLRVGGASHLEFGWGLPKQGDAGKIGYSLFSPGLLDIVGGGTTGGNRAIRFWTEGGAFFTGAIHAPVKHFRIPHPQKAGTDLVHSSLEGPEIAVYYRGEAQLVGGTAVVTLPDYFEALTEQEGRTVQLTSKNGWSPLFVDGEVSGGQFTVKTTDAGDSAQEFYWEVKAVRSDVDALNVEVSSVGNP